MPIVQRYYAATCWLRPVASPAAAFATSCSGRQRLLSIAAASPAEPAAAAQPQLEYWFSTLSTYTYLSTMRIEQQAQQRGVNVLWKPFNVR